LLAIYDNIIFISLHLFLFLQFEGKYSFFVCDLIIAALCD
jgi:hypothetical protein